VGDAEVFESELLWWRLLRQTYNVTTFRSQLVLMWRRRGLDIRIIADADMQEAYYLSSQAFRGGVRDDNYAVNRLKDENRHETTTLGVYDEDGLQAKVVIVNYIQVFGEQFTAPMGGIAGVASLPASRGKGYASSCLKYALEYMKDNGQFLSALYPFAWAYYRNLGWEWVGVQREYTVPTRRIVASPETERVRAAKITGGDSDSIAAIYANYSKGYRGMAQRDAKAWSRRLDDSENHHRYTYLYTSDDGPEGYFTFANPDRESTYVDEFIATTPRAYAGLLGLMRRYEMQTRAFKWNSPSDDMLWSVLYHSDMGSRIDPVVQARVVDVQAAFGALRPHASLSGSLTLRIEDSAAPWNEGVWKIGTDSGGVSVERSSDDPDVSCDIQALTQAYYGEPGLREVRKAGRVVINSERAYTLLAQLLDGPLMWLNDHF